MTSEKCFWRPGISIVEQLIESVSPLFRFIMVVIMIYLFVHDDSLTRDSPRRPNNYVNCRS